MSYKSLESVIRGVARDEQIQEAKNIKLMQIHNVLAKTKNSREGLAALKKVFRVNDAEAKKLLDRAMNEGYEFSELTEQMNVGIKSPAERPRIKQPMSTEQEDPTNPDTGGAEETEMGKRQLHFIKYAAEEIMDYVDKKGDMDEWFQNKLANVHSMIRGLHSYIEGDKRLKGMVSEETMKLAGVTLQNMEHCPGAVAAFKQNLKDGANEKDVAIAAQAVDAYLAIEDKAIEEGEAEPEDIEKMKALIANAKKVISDKGLKGHTYHDMHLKRVMDMLEDDDDDEEDVSEAARSKGAPKIKGDWLKKERERNREHDAAMGRTPTGRKKPERAMTSTQRSLAKMRGEETELDEKAMSQAQQKAAGAALAAKRGEIKPSELVGASKEMYNSMTTKELEDFASTKHKGLPKKVDEASKPDAAEVMRRKQQMSNISQSDKDKLAKVRQMLDKEKKNVSETSNLDEISDKLKGRYIRKASDSHQHASNVRRDAISRGDKETADKAAALMKKRNKGVSRAFGEEVENVNENELATTRRSDFGVEKVRMPDGSYKWKKKPKKEIQVETKAAPKGYHFTKDGKLKKGDADVDGPGGAKLRSDPLDKQRSKIPPLPEGGYQVSSSGSISKPAPRPKKRFPAGPLGF